MPEAKLVPPPTKGHASIAKVSHAWYVVCESHELGKKPVPVELLGTPLVLFRADGGKPAALLDRCPHRNAPLSLGRVVAGGRLECAYHGWQFEGAGRCALVPGLIGGSEARERRVPACATREQGGFVWVWAELDAEPTHEPFALGDAPAGYARVVRRVEAPGTLHATLENALDVPHTAFLHRGLFRGAGKRNEIRATVRRSADRVEVEYAGEPRPSGAVGYLLSPSGGTVEHWDRFILPSIAQVEYRLGRESHFTVTAFGTPVSDFVTRLFAVVDFRSPIPSWLVRPFLEPVALSIFKQDVRMLGAQSETVRAFGGEQYMSTELDLIGPHIWRLLKQAEAGERAPDETSVEREVRFLA
ncbi:MAG TPA: aromatic ring-hydroxylating dioxygenase subunit alpha [Polyangiaceae bacterium]|nr:aromatic ring-hydroxylating dioxygenase subunit alpha [Polyangiaceae bacterium]